MPERLAAGGLLTGAGRAGELAEAVPLTGRILNMADTMHSTRIAVRGLHRAAARHRGIPEVDAPRRQASRELAGIRRLGA